MPEPQILFQGPGKIGVNHGGAYGRDIEGHVSDEFPVPLLRPRNPAVQLAGDPNEHALDAVVEVVQDGAARPKCVGVVSRWRAGQLGLERAET